MLSAMEAKEKKTMCNECHKYVRNNCQALECDTCGEWVHRTCGTSFTSADYLKINERIEQGILFTWECSSCKAKARQEDSVVSGALVSSASETTNASTISTGVATEMEQMVPDNLINNEHDERYLNLVFF